MSKIEIFEQLKMDQNLRCHELNWINSLDENGKLMFAKRKSRLESELKVIGRLIDNLLGVSR